MHIDLASSTENDAVLINDVDLAGGLDRTEDLGWHSVKVANFVEHDPLVRMVSAGALIETERGILSDVEALPV